MITKLSMRSAIDLCRRLQESRPLAARNPYWCNLGLGYLSHTTGLWIGESASFLWDQWLCMRTEISMFLAHGNKRESIICSFGFAGFSAMENLLKETDADLMGIFPGFCLTKALITVNNK
ncbi:hypothetical protein SLA2020_413860 [Shorea laevis]